jgi:hypothetical protein
MVGITRALVYKHELERTNLSASISMVFWPSWGPRASSGTALTRILADTGLLSWQVAGSNQGFVTGRAFRRAEKASQ